MPDAAIDKVDDEESRVISEWVDVLTTSEGDREANFRMFAVVRQLAYLSVTVEVTIKVLFENLKQTTL